MPAANDDDVVSLVPTNHVKSDKSLDSQRFAARKIKENRAQSQSAGYGNFSRETNVFLTF